MTNVLIVTSKKNSRPDESLRTSFDPQPAETADLTALHRNAQRNRSALVVFCGKLFNREASGVEHPRLMLAPIANHRAQECDFDVRKDFYA